MIENLRRIIVLFITILLIHLLFIGCAIKGNEKDITSTNSDRRSYTGYEIGVNYVTHIYTLANAGFNDEEYVKKYGNTIPKEDLLFLKENTNLIQFSKGVNGKLAWMFYFLPAYNNFEDEKEWENYFQDWEKSIIENNGDYIKQYCNEHINKGIYHYYKDIDNKTLNKKVKVISSIYVKNFKTYKTKVWPEIEPKLKKRSDELNEELLEFPYIDRWEEVTGYDFGDNDYYVALFYAGKNGPTWNNVSLYKNTAFSDPNKEYMLDMFSHELGIHIMISEILSEIDKFKAKGVPHKVIYNGFELLATFYNQKVRNKSGNDTYYEDSKKFLDIYSKLYESGIRKPKTLFVEGVNEYLKNSQ